MMFQNTINNRLWNIESFKEFCAQFYVTTFALNNFSNIMKQTPKSDNIYISTNLRRYMKSDLCLLKSMYYKILSIRSSEFKSTKNLNKLGREIVYAYCLHQLFPLINHDFFNSFLFLF